jgi:hypothetical protein
MTIRPRIWNFGFRPQPSGIRAVDALAWAREIIDRYRELN